MTQDPFAAPPPGAAPAPPAYGEPVYGAPLAGRSNGFGVAALVLGVLSLFGVFTVVLGVLFGVLAVVFGLLGRRRAKRGEADNGGMALAGIISGILALLLSVGIVVAVIVFLRSGTGKDLRSCLSDAHGDKAATTACRRRFEREITGG